jgi:hypothetical protein
MRDSGDALNLESPVKLPHRCRFQLDSISSSVLPFVSGTINTTKRVLARLHPA